MESAPSPIAPQAPRLTQETSGSNESDENAGDCATQDCAPDRAPASDADELATLAEQFANPTPEQGAALKALLVLS